MTADVGQRESAWMLLVSFRSGADSLIPMRSVVQLEWSSLYGPRLQLVTGEWIDLGGTVIRVVPESRLASYLSRHLGRAPARGLAAGG